MSENFGVKYRPNNLDEIFGHTTTIKDIKKHFAENSIPDVVLISGYPGTGKTTLLRIIAKAASCLDKDGKGNPCNKCEICTTIDSGKMSYIFFEKNASDIQIDNAREIKEMVERKPFGKYNKRIFIIDEIQEFSKNKAALNDLLKILEKTYSNAHFLFATSDMTKVPITIKRRSLFYKLNSLSFQDITRYLEYICKSENVKIDNVEKANTLIAIAQNSNGSMGLAANYLMRVIYSELWNKDELLKELDIISDTDAIVIINYILEGNVKAFEYKIDEEVLKKIKYLLMLYYKKINGVELNGWQLGQVKEIVCDDKNKIFIILEKLNELSNYPYIYPDLIEFYVLCAINKIKSHIQQNNFTDNINEKPRRVKQQ